MGIIFKTDLMFFAERSEEQLGHPIRGFGEKVPRSVKCSVERQEHCHVVVPAVPNPVPRRSDIRCVFRNCSDIVITKKEKFSNKE